MKPLELLYLCDYAANTGYATVMKNLVPLTKRAWGNRSKQHPNDHQPMRITILAINYFGEHYEEPDGTMVFSAKLTGPMIGEDKDGNPKADDFGRAVFMRVLKDSSGMEIDGKPTDAYDGIFILQDAGVISSFVPGLKMIKDEKTRMNLKNFKSVIYFPMDHGQQAVIEIITKGLEFFDTLVTYNEYSRQQIIKANPALKRKLQVVPHGINPKQFYPLDLEEKIKFRMEFFGQENAGKFIVLNLNRNQHRKDIPCTILAFEEFKKEHCPDAFLYLHMNPADPMGWDLRGVLAQTDLIEGRDFMLPPRERQNHDFTEAELNGIYNSCDVYVTTTTGEGWGLGVTEAMACRLPVICPLHTSFIEITDAGRRAYLLENLYPSCNWIDNIIRHQCDYMEVAERLNEVRQNIVDDIPAHKEKLDRAEKYMHSLSWENIAERWVDIFKKTY